MTSAVAEGMGVSVGHGLGLFGHVCLDGLGGSGVEEAAVKGWFGRGFRCGGAATGGEQQTGCQQGEKDAVIF